jgi:hypothetical protein
MADNSKALLEFLEKLVVERDELNVLITGIEKRLGITRGAQSAEGDPSATPRVAISIDAIPVGFFHNLSQTAAAEKLLRLNPGQALTTKEILDTFRKSGMQLNPKNASTIIYTMLNRDSRFERVAGKAWGLAEWYPERRKRSDSDEEKEPATKPKSETVRAAKKGEKPKPVSLVPPGLLKDAKQS